MSLGKVIKLSRQETAARIDFPPKENTTTLPSRPVPSPGLRHDSNNGQAKTNHVEYKLRQRPLTL